MSIEKKHITKHEAQEAWDRLRTKLTTRQATEEGDDVRIMETFFHEGQEAHQATSAEKSKAVLHGKS